MVNKRMLAVAAVLVLAVPAMGAAATIYVPGPTTEQLVEGHTVFTVIQVYNNTTTTTAQFAAAVAVLVREQTNANANARFPGVLWFNDQYLVDPESPSPATATYRYPCGGAVMAVNQGDPDPRILLADVNGKDPLNGSAGAPPSQGAPDYDAITNVGYNNDRAVLGVNTASGSPVVYSDSEPGANYSESYFVTDPNDHSWIIDKYTGYTRSSPVVGTPPAPTGWTLQSYPIWVVNIMGGPAFLPDDGQVSCQPYVDGILTTVYGTAPVPASDQVYPDSTTRQVNCQTGAPWNNQYTGNPTMIDQPAKDQPCAGANEPAGEGGASYCYDGNQYKGGDCNNTALYPTRLYNAVLYFHLEDLTVAGASSVQHPNTDTNGCQTNTEWQCPNGDDNAEGNSHPFNNAGPGSDSATSPSSAPNTGLPCPRDPSRVNHGGSAGATYLGNGVWSDPNGCDYSHATRMIDLYFDGSGRPLPPLSRQYKTTWSSGSVDTEGSQAPFAGLGNDGKTATNTGANPP